MSQNLNDCSCSCPTPTTINTPGIQGQNAFTITTDVSGFVVPPLGNQVTIGVASTAWMAVGQTIFIPGAGTFTVDNINSGASVLMTYQNITQNTNAGTTIAMGTLVTASGIPGVNGQNAYTIVASPGFTTPNFGSSVSIPVGNSQWMSVGQTVFIQGSGYFTVASIADSTDFTGTYLNVPGNVNTNPVISAGAGVSAAGASVSGYQELKKVYISGVTVSYSPTAGVRALYVECIGAGGSGGGGASTASDASCAGGGGSGAYSAVFLTSVKSTYTVQAGAGGVAPTAGNNPGNAGTATTFDSPSVCTADFGLGGDGGGAAGTTNLTTAGGAGGLASNGIGDFLCDGNDGGNGIRVSGVEGMSGFGAGSTLGGQRAGVVVQGDGATGGNYGAGGSGGATINGGGTTAGGAGGGGLIRVTEYV